MKVDRSKKSKSMTELNNESWKWTIARKIAAYMVVM